MKVLKIKNKNGRFRTLTNDMEDGVILNKLKRVLEMELNEECVINDIGGIGEDMGNMEGE